MKTSEFDFPVPPELIARAPAEKRDLSRLMVLDRKTQTIQHRYFYDIADYLSSGDLLILNDTKVMPANLTGKKEEGGVRVEVLLSKPLPATRNRYECLVKPGKRLKVGSRVIFGRGEVIGTVLEKTETGEQIIEFEGELEGFMRRHGEIPLPPYVKMSNEGKYPKLKLGERYQTVYAEKEGASAAPTAGLHFTPELLKKIEGKGVKIAYVTLHTGLATFKPVYAENIEDHKMYAEYFEVPEGTVRALEKAKRVIAVGTTSVRTLESLKKREGELKGETDLFIYPGYQFKAVDAMITNFHWPRTTLIMLVSAFAGKDFVMRAYQEAVRQKYRFFSFGDAMLIV